MARTFKIGVDPKVVKQMAEANAVSYIRAVLRTKKPFMDFDYIYGTGVLFRPLTREEVENLYNEISK